MQENKRENKNILSSIWEGNQNYRLLKRKGKPFWLNFQHNKSKNYEKYRNELNPETTQFVINQQQQEELTTSHQHINREQSKKQSYLQSYQSLNQNYQEDFQSYKSTIKQQQQSIQIMKKQHLNNNPASNSQKLNTKHFLFQNRLMKTPTRKVNLSSLSRINTGKIIQRSHIQRSRIKTQQTSSLKSEIIDINTQICMMESPNYLQKENEKMLKTIRQMRQLLPILNLNQQELTYQTLEISQLRDQVDKATSTSYEFQLEKNKSFLQSNKKIIQMNIKTLNSPKKNISQLLTKRNESQSYVNHEERIREQLLAKLRLLSLKEEKSFHLDKKINLYKKIIQQASKKQKIQSFSSLQRRKIFLQWDVQRMKNNFDLKILQENIHINQLMDEIELTERKISQHEKHVNILLQQNQRVDENKINLKAQANTSIKTDPSKTKELPNIVTPKKQKINESSSYLFKLLDKSSSSNQKTNFYQKNQKQKHLLSLNQKSLPEIFENKSSISSHFQSSFQKKQKHNRNISNNSIRGNKFVFKNPSFNEDLQEIML